MSKDLHWMGVDEAADYARVSAGTSRRWLREGRAFAAAEVIQDHRDAQASEQDDARHEALGALAEASAAEDDGGSDG